ncbi:hypothetical protein ACHAXR_012653, partial [Thalassiosira sp. AJA248-18]
MNLALLNPFRQADRIDSTLTIPRALHPPRPKENNRGGAGKSTATTTTATKTTATAEAPAAAAAVESDEKKKPSATTSVESSTFKIPKKVKSIDGSTTTTTSTNSSKLLLFKQSLKLSKLSKGGGEQHDAAATTTTNTTNGTSGKSGGDTIGGEGKVRPSSSVLEYAAAAASKSKEEAPGAGGEGGSQSAKAMEIDESNKKVVAEEDDKSTKDVEMKDVSESTTTAIEGGKSHDDDIDAAAAAATVKQEGDNEATAATTTTTSTTTATPKQKKKKKKRKKKSPKSKTDNASSSEEEDDNNNNDTTNNNNNNDNNNDDDDDESENYWTACYSVSFNRRGSFLASGHASGLIPVHDFMGRTMSALYWPPPGIKVPKGRKNGSALLSSFVYSDHDDDNAADAGGSGNKKWDGSSGGGIGAGGKRGSSGVEKEHSGKKKKRGPKPKKKKLGKGSSKKDEDANGGGSRSSSLVKISSSDDLLVSSSAVAAAAAAGGIEGGKAKGESKSASTTAKSAAATPSTVSSSSDNKDTTIHDEEESNNQLQYMNGVTSLSWDRRSRTLLAGAIGDKNLRLMDNTHPLVSTDCTDAVRRLFISESGGKDVISENETPSSLEEKKDSVIAMSPPILATLPSPPAPSKCYDNIAPERIAVRLETVSLGRARLLCSNIVPMGNKSESLSSSSSSSSSDPSDSGHFFKGSILKPPSVAQQHSQAAVPSETLKQSSTIMIPTRRHPTLLLELPQPLGGPIELHPCDSHAGLACMIDGSLSLFWMPPMAFYETLYSSITNVMDDNEKKQWVVKLLKEEEKKRVGNLLYLVPRLEPSAAKPSSPQYFITCAAFGKNGEVIWAVTKCGNLLAFRIDSSMMNMLRGCNMDKSSSAAVAYANQMVKPTLCVKVPGGAAAWQIKLSRNWKHLLINSADCSLRLYDVEELIEEFDTSPSGQGENDTMQQADIKPRFVFQDNISKAPWASCDFSGDGEYVCGGCNSYPQPGDNYKIFLWNSINGELVDQLTGPVSSLYSLSCHPTRPFIAVGTSDGLIDVWGARLDWVAFAPDFQALQQNELYEEKEDEFDIVIDCKGEEENDGKGASVYSRLSPEDDDVDITTIGKVPAFDSDSEDESEVFYFDTKVDKILSEKQPGP